MKKPEMTRRERVLAVVNHQPTDRVPTDYWGVGEITEKLMKHFGISDNDHIALADALDIDSPLGIWTPHKPGLDKDPFGLEWKKIPLPDGSGFYDEPVAHPLAKYETVDDIEANFTWPKPEDVYDYSGIPELIKKYKKEDRAIDGGYISLTYQYDLLRGTEQMLLDFGGDPEMADYMLERLDGFYATHSENILKAADGAIDWSQCTDDFGSQHSLLMSEKMIERYLGKYYRKNIAMIKSYGAKVFHHDDGAVASLIPWIIETGCEILNPLQWHLPGWDLHEIKKKYGEKLCFHGGIDNQLVLPFQSVNEVKAEVEACIDALYKPDRTGYILAPCHNCQAFTPVENILTMYEHAREYSSRI